MTQSGVFPSGLFQLRKVSADAFFRIKQTPRNQDPCDCRCYGLGHRLGQVQRALGHLVKVALIENLAMMNNQNAVGIVLQEPVDYAGGLARVAGEGYRIKIGRILLKLPDGAVAPPDFNSWQNLADVLKRPAVPGSAIPFVPGDSCVRGNGKTPHGFHD